MRLLIAAGSSGGHFFPGYSLAEQSRKTALFEDVLVVVGKQAKPFIEHCRKLRVEYSFLPTVKLSWDIISFLYNMIRSLYLSNNLIRKYKPHVVVGFGSYISVPIILVAWCYRIPILIHEQNATMGLANQIVSNFAKTIAFSFPPPATIHKKKCTIVHSGNLIREHIRLRSMGALHSKRHC